MPMHHLLATDDLSDSDVNEILGEARSIVPTLGLRHDRFYSLPGRTAALVFFEPSTRTRLSFETAAHRLGVSPVVFQTHGSSVEKGESLNETIATIEAMRFDVLIIRHGSNGVMRQLIPSSSIPIINAGEGTASHPTQALLDVSTLIERHGTVRGLKVSVIGDILHSRVARSQVTLLRRLGAEVTVCAPDEFMPIQTDDVFHGLQRFETIDAALAWCDVASMLRIQHERICDQSILSLNAYRDQYALTSQRAGQFKNVTVIHPGPVNNGVEIDEAILSHPNVLVHRQVTHGVAVRMAVLKWLLSTPTSR